MQQPLTRQAVREDPGGRTNVGLVGLALLATGVFIVLRPFISALLWAVIMTYSTFGLYRRVERWLGGRRS